MITYINYLNAVYDVLMKTGGAREDERDSFITNHTSTQGCDEYRFQGHFGFGGKYRSKTNTADYYAEDKTPELELRVSNLNAQLSALNLFKCDKCNRTDLAGMFPEAQNVTTRLKYNEPYTDRECPVCKGLVYRVATLRPQ